MSNHSFLKAFKASRNPPLSWFAFLALYGGSRLIRFIHNDITAASVLDREKISLACTSISYHWARVSSDCTVERGLKVPAHCLTLLKCFISGLPDSLYQTCVPCLGWETIFCI